MDNLNDLISRATARDVINTWGRHENETVRMILLHHDINAVPAVNAAPVVHGRWESWHTSIGYIEQCSECGAGYDGVTGWSYCPNCGAKMDDE